MFKKSFCLLFLLFSFFIQRSECSTIDSLKAFITNTDSPKEDLLKAYLSLSKDFDNDSATFYAEQGKAYFTKINYADGVATCNSRLASYHVEKGNLETALDYYFEILKDSANIKIGALSSAYNGIGAIYRRLGEYHKALSFYDKSLNIAHQTQRHLDFAMVYNNKAIIYDLLHKPDTSLSYYNRCLKHVPLLEDQNLKMRLNFALLINMGLLYSKKDEFEKAVTNFKNALEVGRAEKNNYFISNALMTLGATYQKQKKYAAAEKVLKEALFLTIKNDNKFLMKENNNILYLLYKEWGKEKEALEYYESFINIRDSIQGIDIQNNMSELEVKYDTEKKEQALQLSNAQLAVSNTKLEHEELISSIMRWIGLLGLGIIGFISYLFIQKKKKNKEIALKNRQITDSIDYAKRIQQAVYPSKKLIQQLFPTNFIYLRPKDIVSGDFYWANENETTKYFAIADCTGHGVPGAFMTIVGINILNQSISESVNNSAQIIQSINTNLRTRLGEKSKDGMDFAICAIDKKTNLLDFCGTHLSCYIIRNGEVIVLKGSRAYIGLNEQIKVQSHQFQLEKEDTLYLFSDGYPDQKGGNNNKKYYYPPMVNLLLSITKLSMDEQRSKLKENFDSWKGNVEQFDDVLVVGIKI